MITISCCAHCRSINFIGLPYHKTNAYGLLLLYLFISLQMAVKYINNNGLALDRVHNSRRPLDRFHYFALSALWPCDLNLWPFSHKITSLVVYPNIIPNTKFEHFWIIRLWVIVRTDRQTDGRTHRQTRMNALLPRLSSAWVIKRSRHTCTNRWQWSRKQRWAIIQLSIYWLAKQLDIHVHVELILILIS